MMRNSNALCKKMSEPTLGNSKSLVLALYRRLFKEVKELDQQPLVKTLFPFPKDLQQQLGIKSLYIPNEVKYADVLKNVFNSGRPKEDMNIGFDLLNRIRAHKENLKELLPGMKSTNKNLVYALHQCLSKRTNLKAEKLTLPLNHDSMEPLMLPSRNNRSRGRAMQTRVASVLSEGTVLLAHPLSSAHVDRRAMLITEQTPLSTAAVVLDLRFTYPLSQGNPMFPEVFWGHDVYDGGFSQIGFTMPPTAQISILHTLDPAVGCEKKGEDCTVTKEEDKLKKEHKVFCHPLIRGSTLDNGKVEPTLYLSKVEALPYLSKLALGASRDSLRIFWGSMCWPASQLEAEVRAGHWIPVKVSSSIFQSYDATGGSVKERFPTKEELAKTKELRETYYGGNISPPQTFPPDQTLRKREPLWDAILYLIGGEYHDLIGCNNPFTGNPRWTAPQIIAHDVPRLLEAKESIKEVAGQTADEHSEEESSESKEKPKSDGTHSSSDKED